MRPCTTSGLQAGSRRLSDGGVTGFGEWSARPVSVAPYDKEYPPRCSEAYCEPSHVSERTSAGDDIEARLRQALARTPIPPSTRPEVRLPSLEASKAQGKVEKPHKENTIQGYQCADESIYDGLDVASDPFAPSDKLQTNPVSGARSLSPRDDQRNLSTPIVSTYGNIWDHAGSSNLSQADTDPESDSSGSDVLRFPRRTRARKHGDDALASPSPSPQPSQASEHSKRRHRLRRGQAGVQQSASPPTAYVVIPPTPKHMTSSSTRTPARNRPITCLASSQIVDSKFQVVIELPASAFDSLCMGARGKSVTSERNVVARSRYSARENVLLAQLKRQMKPKLTWKKIQTYFPDRTVNALQVHYYTHFRSWRHKE